ncbi:hypothetical protein GCM10023149_04610 [Mucilaginibacter gynuensis]|uniref:FixH protein n=1 Tax=Mucilaginibacter gynuensis TaxID=1302236 RepID=A0ABP8FSD5_9SPHI
MKMNWGKGIVIGMVCFMLFIIVMVVAMFSQPADDYDKQYYEKGLAYDKDYKRAQQVIKDKAQPVIEFKGAEALIHFRTPVKGQVTFARPSDRNMDEKYDLDVDSENTAHIPLTRLKTGQWQLTFEWTANNNQYLYKKEVYLP